MQIAKSTLFLSWKVFFFLLSENGFLLCLHHHRVLRRWFFTDFTSVPPRLPPFWEPTLVLFNAESPTEGGSLMDFSFWDMFDPVLTLLADSWPPLWDCPPTTGCFNDYFCFESIQGLPDSRVITWSQGSPTSSLKTILFFTSTVLSKLHEIFIIFIMK